jgi:SAM-dependent methyltransferase
MFTIEFHDIPLEPFRDLPGEIRTEAFFRAHEFTAAYVALQSARVVRAMGASALDPPGAAAAVERLGVAPDRAGAWDWVARMVRESVRVRRYEGLEEDVAADTAPGSSAGGAFLRNRILDEDRALAPALELIDAAAAGYPGFLRGERDGGSILFDPSCPALWDRYFDNANPIYAPGNTLAAHAAALALEARGRSDGVRVLEVGAGCGSAAEALLSRAGKFMARYVLTDISPNFLRKARERVSATAPDGGLRLEYRLLDLNRPADTWPVERSAHDVVFAVNVLHSVRALESVLEGIRALLAPGGLLVLGECVRPERGKPVHPEFIFQLLDEFRRPHLDPESRPEPGFLDAASWRKSLARAGFEDVRFVPEFEPAVAAYPEHSIAAITSEARR